MAQTLIGKQLPNAGTALLCQPCVTYGVLKFLYLSLLVSLVAKHIVRLRGNLRNLGNTGLCISPVGFGCHRLEEQLSCMTAEIKLHSATKFVFSEFPSIPDRALPQTHPQLQPDNRQPRF